MKILIIFRGTDKSANIASTVKYKILKDSNMREFCDLKLLNADKKQVVKHLDNNYYDRIYVDSYHEDIVSSVKARGYSMDIKVYSLDEYTSKEYVHPQGYIKVKYSILADDLIYELYEKYRETLDKELYFKATYDNMIVPVEMCKLDWDNVDYFEREKYFKNKEECRKYIISKLEKDINCNVDKISELRLRIDRDKEKLLILKGQQSFFNEE